MATAAACSRANIGRPRQVGAFEAHLHAVLGRQLRAQPFDLGRIAEAVEHEVGAAGGQRMRDAQADPAGRAGDECRLAFHVRTP
jgi:hypothetical protein